MLGTTPLRRPHSMSFHYTKDPRNTSPTLIHCFFFFLIYLFKKQDSSTNPLHRELSNLLIILHKIACPYLLSDKQQNHGLRFWVSAPSPALSVRISSYWPRPKYIHVPLAAPWPQIRATSIPALDHWLRLRRQIQRKRSETFWTLKSDQNRRWTFEKSPHQ